MATEESLPAEILLKVVEDHLPATAQCRFRSVCKAWKSPSVRRGAFAGWYVCRFLCFKEEASGWIKIFNGGKWYTLHDMPSDYVEIWACMNGLLLGILGISFEARLSVFDIFQGHWTELPTPPPAPKKELMFVGMEHINRHHPCVGTTLLDDYIFVVLRGSRCRKRKFVINLELQVYDRGTWTSSFLHIPDQHYIMFLTSGWKEGCFALHGSKLYFLAELLDLSAVNLCCVDVLGPGVDAKVVCRLCAAVSRLSAVFCTKLAVCSGKLMLVSQKFETEVIEVYSLDEEKSEWRYVSRLPPEAWRDRDVSRLRFVHGGDHELVLYTDPPFSHIYNALSNTWSTFDFPSNGVACMTIIPVVTKPLK